MALRGSWRQRRQTGETMSMETKVGTPPPSCVSVGESRVVSPFSARLALDALPPKRPKRNEKKRRGQKHPIAPPIPSYPPPHPHLAAAAAAARSPASFAGDRRTDPFRSPAPPPPLPRPRSPAPRPPCLSAPPGNQIHPVSRHPLVVA
uniref:Uncharacterized protein n=1 Tax=Oryza barthii TaxID=65489 RepID=A0A0D3F3U8_9ORYZ